MLDRGQIVSHAEMCASERYSLQAGMNYRPRGKSYSIVLMSQRKGARYPDRVEDEGRRILYVGHDIKRTPGGVDPRVTDQIAMESNGRSTENGKFVEAVNQYKSGLRGPEPVRVYEKIKDNIWVYNGLFALRDYSRVFDGIRYISVYTGYRRRISGFSCAAGRTSLAGHSLRNKGRGLEERQGCVPDLRRQDRSPF